jgi:hypothetical protein
MQRAYKGFWPKPHVHPLFARAFDIIEAKKSCLRRSKTGWREEYKTVRFVAMPRRRVADEMSLPRLCCSSVFVVACSHVPPREGYPGKPEHEPVLFAAELYVRHQSFNELLRGVFRTARVELFLRSGWVPTQVAFAAAERRGCFACCWRGAREPPEARRVVVSEETYREHHAALFVGGLPIHCEMRMQRDLMDVSTASFELYICVRDTLATMGLETNLRYYSDASAAIVRQPTDRSVVSEQK